MNPFCRILSRYSFGPAIISSPQPVPISSFDHLVHQLRDPREYVPSVSGRLDERESVRQSRHPHLFQLPNRPSVALILPYRAQRGRRSLQVNISCAFLMHRDLEQVGDRTHNVGVRAVREDRLDPLVQVLVTYDTVISFCGSMKERMHSRQGDDFGVLVTDIRQNMVEDFRFDVIDLCGSQNGTDERSREEGRGWIANSQQRKGHPREVPPFGGFMFLGRFRVRVCVLEKYPESLVRGGKRDQGQEIAQGIVINRIVGWHLPFAAFAPGRNFQQRTESSACRFLQILVSHPFEQDGGQREREARVERK